MNRLFISSLIILFSGSNLIAQDAGYLPGYVVFNNKDTLQGLVKYINQVPFRVLPDIKFRENKGAKTEKFTPNELLGYKAGDKIFHSLTLPGYSNGEKAFMELIIDGHVRLYEWQVTGFGAPQQGTGTSSSYYLGKPGNRRVFDIDTGKFKEAVSEYFGDHPEISEKIKTGVYKRRDIKVIVREYNRTK